MFEIFQKKERYGKVSLKFKNHFENRVAKVNFVSSKQTKIEEKMKMFKELINDDFKMNQKSVALKNSYYNDKKETPQQYYSKQFNELIKMTEGVNEWAKIKTSKQQQNLKGWNYNKLLKQQKRKKDLIQLKQILKIKLNLKQLSKISHHDQRLRNDLYTKIQSHLSQSTQIPYFQTYSKVPSDWNCLKISQTPKKKSKPKHRLQFSYGSKPCNKGQSQSNSCIIKSTFLNRQDKLSKTFNNQNSLQFKIPNQSVKSNSNVEESFPTKQPFQDKLIFDKMNLFDSVLSNSASLSSSIYRNNLMKSKSQSFCKKQHQMIVIPQQIAKQLKLKTSRPIQCQQNIIFKTPIKTPFDVRKLNAVKKIKIL